jgi:hypothetical protein
MFSEHDGNFYALSCIYPRQLSLAAPPSANYQRAYSAVTLIMRNQPPFLYHHERYPHRSVRSAAILLENHSFRQIAQTGFTIYSADEGGVVHGIKFAAK